VPDWADVSIKQRLVDLGPSYQAAGSTNAHVSFSKDSSILHTQGFCLGCVNYCAMKCVVPFSKDGAQSFLGAEVWEPIVRCVLSWRQMLFSFPVADHAEDILQRMLVLDSTTSNRQRMRAWFEQMDESVHLNNNVALDESSRATLTAIGALIDGRRFMMSFHTRDGAHLSTQDCLNNTNPVLGAFVGLAPNETAQGDIICVLLGCKCPVILRSVENHYILIGEAYIDGCMYGEALRTAANGSLKLQTFDIY